MLRRYTIGLAGVLLLTVLPMTTATATPPADVTFDFEFFFGAEDNTFEAWGSAVDDGLMCPSGAIQEGPFRQSHFGKNVTPFDTFICDEVGAFGPEDSFDFKAQIHIHDFPYFSGSWVILGGTGAFEDIHGTGSADGIFLFDDEGNIVAVDETRSGSMHLN